MSRRKRALAVALLGGFFVLGGVGGFALGKTVAERDLAQGLFAGDHQRREEVLLLALTHQLDLNASQQDHVRAISRRYAGQRQAALQEVANSCGKPLHALHDRMDAEIAALLDQRQAPLFQDFVRKRKARFHGAGQGQK